MKTPTALAGMVLAATAWAGEPYVAPPLPAIQEIRCAGNVHTSCAFIRGHLHLRAGDPLDEEEIRNAQLRLSSSRNFDVVDIRLEKGADRGEVIVVIEVREAGPLTMEWLLAGSSRPGSDRGVVAARFGNQNLFGKGKIADVSAFAIVPVSGDARDESYDLALRYADPHLFGSSRYFGIASARWRRRDYLDRYGNQGNLDAGQMEVLIGRRFGDFSYLSIGFGWRPDNDWVSHTWNRDGEYITRSAESYSESPSRLIYGWSTEDDLHFPTQGTSFQVQLGGDYEPSSPEGRQHLQFRKTWPLAGGYWTVQLGGEPSPEYRSSFGEKQLLALTFGKPVKPGDEITRGRWYVEPGYAIKGHDSGGRTISQYGLKAGFRADTRSFGYVDFYLLATRDSLR
jgi:hypothetical protein